MAISIPAVVDANLAAIQAALRPLQDAATGIASSPVPPYALGNRVADLLRDLTALIDSGTLTATTGAETDGFTDAAAFTGVNSLTGATFTYASDTTTVALRGLSFKIASNTVNKVVFTEAAPTANQVGDTGTVEFDTVDDQIAVLDDGKGPGASQSNPYSDGRPALHACALVIELLGGTLPTYVDPIHSTEPYDSNEGGWANPHSGGGARGHGGGVLVADLLQVVRDTVAAYTAPA